MPHKKYRGKRNWNLWEMETLKKSIYVVHQKKAITNKSFELLTLYFVVSSVQCLCLSMLSLLCTPLILFCFLHRYPIVMYWISIDLLNNSLRFTLKHHHYISLQLALLCSSFLFSSHTFSSFSCYVL